MIEWLLDNFEHHKRKNKLGVEEYQFTPKINSQLFDITKMVNFDKQNTYTLKELQKIYDSTKKPSVW